STFFTPLVYWYTPCTPQKQPPASTAVCVGPAALGLSSAGAGMTTAASPERPGVFHTTPAAATTSTPIHHPFFTTSRIPDSFFVATRLSRWTCRDLTGSACAPPPAAARVYPWAPETQWWRPCPRRYW